jgi:hypothetical protein
MLETDSQGSVATPLADWYQRSTKAPLGYLIYSLALVLGKGVDPNEVFRLGQAALLANPAHPHTHVLRLNADSHGTRFNYSRKTFSDFSG